jgi:hypothetical protein
LFRHIENLVKLRDHLFFKNENMEDEIAPNPDPNKRDNSAFSKSEIFFATPI